MKTDLCIFGEVLYDHFPDGSKVLGGAPFNVAWHLNAFGLAPLFISRVGQDIEATQIRQTMQEHGMNSTALQTDRLLPTGRVDIEIINNEPEYDIFSPCAYDEIEASPLSATSCKILYHGTLALRHAKSRATLQEFIKQRPDRIFIDVNLRSPWWNRDDVLGMINNAHWLKLNTAELNQLFPSTLTMPQRLKAVIASNQLEGVILTHGSQGAELMTEGVEHITIQPTSEVKIVDTVGAGDAFSAVIILGLMNNWPLPVTLERAQDFASEIVGQRGATVTDKNFYRHFLAQWGLH